MLVKLNSKSQIRLPEDIINSMQLKQGDQFEVLVEDGKIILVPVAIYREQVIKNLKSSADETRESIKNGELAVYDSNDSLFVHLDK